MGHRLPGPLGDNSSELILGARDLSHRDPCRLQQGIQPSPIQLQTLGSLISLLSASTN